MIFCVGSHSTGESGGGWPKNCLCGPKEGSDYCSGLGGCLSHLQHMMVASLFLPQMEFWKGYTNSVYSVKDPGHSTERSDAMYVVVPLLGVALLIVIALFIIWRCQLQKATRHRPSYAQNRYLASRTGRSLPRVMVYRERSQSQGETQYQREASNRVAGDGRAGGTPQQDGTLYPPEHSVSVLSRLSSATPPPSYEEVTGHPESSSGEETSISYNDPPPKYEEIVATAPATGK